MRLTSLHVYPVKSARGLSPTEWEAGERGFEGDRRFMIVDREGHFWSQRTVPRMALIDALPEGDRLRLSAPGLSLEVPLRPAAGEPRRVEVWGDEMDALSLGPEAARALSEFLEGACELVYMPDESRRQVNPDYAPPGLTVGFADGFPYLLTTTASLAELARLGGDVPMDRFRPNLVVEGAAPFEEDGWGEITVGEVCFRVVKPCARCPIPNVDQRTGERGLEPTRTLAQHRKRDGQVWFGQNLIALGRGRLRVGDPVKAA
jgi:uncharacterized protein YcbX